MSAGLCADSGRLPGDGADPPCSTEHAPRYDVQTLSLVCSASSD